MSEPVSLLAFESFPQVRGDLQGMTTPMIERTVILSSVFVVWMLLDVVDDALTRAEVGYLGAASLLCVLLAVVYRRPSAPPATTTL